MYNFCFDKQRESAPFECATAALILFISRQAMNLSICCYMFNCGYELDFDTLLKKDIVPSPAAFVSSSGLYKL